MSRRIMIPIDNSHCAARALDVAIREAALNGAQLEIVHVIDYGFLKYEQSANDLLETRRERTAAGMALLDKASQRAEQAGVRHTERLINDTATLGDVTGRLLDHIRETAPDLVIAGTHGIGGLSRAVLGSVAESLVRQGTVPVMLVRADMAIAGVPPATALHQAGA